ncbi:hypothetical protein [uncultured Mediterranean phage uvMED]|nr:hypothetical protein [uncultured Mediterranean phage uvMED]
MAILKIDPVQGKINTGRNVGASRLALPFSLANQQAQGFKAFSDGLVNLYAAQKKEEDLNEAQSITDSLGIDLIKSYNKYKSGSNIEVALEGFNQDVNYKNFEDLGSNKRVKKQVRKYVTDFQRKYSLDLLGKVTENHQSITKARKTQTLNGYIKDIVAGGANALIAERNYNTFFTDPLNLEYYGAEGLEKLRGTKDLELIELSLINRGKTGDVNLFDNKQRKAVLDALPVKSQKAVIEKIRNNNLSEAIKLQEETIFAEKKDKQFKIETFTTLLLAINDAQKNSTDDNIAKVPSIDDLYDLRQSGAINSSQYDTLLKFKAKILQAKDIGLEGAFIPDQTVLQIVNAEFALANSVEKIDSLQEDINLNPDIMEGLTPENIIKYNKLAEKYKNDTTFGSEDKKFRELIEIGSKRITKNAKTFSAFSTVTKTDYDNLIRAEARMNEYDDLTLNKNFTPEQAYAEVIKKFSKDELPELHDLEQPKSVTINNYKEELNAHPKDTFNKLRNEIAKAYVTHRDIELYKDDLRKLDLIEDVYDTRLIINDGKVDRALGKEFKIKKKN